MRKKLEQKNGETLIEALFSLLIAVLSMGILSTAVIISSNINAQNRKNDEEYARKVYQAEGMTDTAKNAVLHIRFETLQEESVSIDLYGGDANDFASYEMKEQAH